MILVHGMRLEDRIELLRRIYRPWADFAILWDIYRWPGPIRNPWVALAVWSSKLPRP